MSHGLLVLLQGMDAGGEDEAIRHVLSTKNPQGCWAKAFRARGGSARLLVAGHGRSPRPRGQIVVFNRSYEQVITKRVHPEWLERPGCSSPR